MKNNRITLKKLKVSKANSRETTCFSGIVCLDGEEIVHVDNDGRGGCNCYLPVQGKSWTDYHVLEGVAITVLPNEKYEHLDCVLDEIMVFMETAKFHANQLKKTKFAIVGQKGDEYSIYSPFNKKIDLAIAMKTAAHAVHIKNCVQKLRDTGYTILNTNLGL